MLAGLEFEKGISSPSAGYSATDWSTAGVLLLTRNNSPDRNAEDLSR
jgi:hypothetical protein